MSKEVTEFRDALKALLREIEDLLDEASERDIDETTKESFAETRGVLAGFRQRVQALTANLREDAPEAARLFRERFEGYSDDAQDAVRQTLAFLATGVSEGAEGASKLLKTSAEHAKTLAESLRAKPGPAGSSVDATD